MSGLLDHAYAEFRAAGWIGEDGKFKDEMQQSMCDDIIELLTVFSQQGHSGFSASYAIELFEKLAKFKPLVPLSGDDSEWNEVSDGVFQNKRCSSVFKQADRFNGQAYDINGIVFYEYVTRDLVEGEDGYPGQTKDKTYFTSSASFVPITFPYTPETKYVEWPMDIS